jgi:2-polyprenyl-3-methyl-5-hydroxy-6-metoxy-1,4-benzoquinol methylase
MVKNIYEYEVDINSDSTPAKIIRLVGKNKRVLELGAGPGSITKFLKITNNCDITALEINADCVEKLSPFCTNVYQCDLNNPSWFNVLDSSLKFDVVVAGDVLEHLYNPSAILQAVKPWLAPNGYFIISLPHIAHNAAVACILQENFQYQDYGLLDNTHIRFLGIHDMQKLVNDAGYSIIDAQFVVKLPEETELANLWETLPKPLKKILGKQKWGNVYQVVIKATLDSSATNINLENVPVPIAKPTPKIPSPKKVKFNLKIYLILLKGRVESFFFNNTITRPLISYLRKVIRAMRKKV